MSYDDDKAVAILEALESRVQRLRRERDEVKSSLGPGHEYTMAYQTLVAVMVDAVKDAYRVAGIERRKTP
jgi:hypothetical protein